MAAPPALPQEAVPGWPLVLVGLLLLLGYAAHVLGRRAHVPRVTLLLIIGAMAGPGGFALVPEEVRAWFPTVAHVTLGIIGFLLGERFLGKQLRGQKRLLLIVLLAEGIFAAAAVFGALAVSGASLIMAILLAGIAPATAPAATVDVVEESGARGPVSRLLLEIVAMDDALGIILFSVLLAVAEGIVAVDTAGGADVSAAALVGGGAADALLAGAWELGGAVLLGAGLGLPMAWLTGRMRPGEPMLMEALGFVLLCSGLAAAIGVSFILCCIVLGAVVANFARHHTRPFHAIGDVHGPLLVVFFLLAGVDFDLDALRTVGWMGAVYVGARVVGKVAGGTLGAIAAGAPRAVRRYLGPCLLPQAGVALGLALHASERLPDQAAALPSLIVGTTIVFEIAGPLATRLSLARAGET